MLKSFAVDVITRPLVAILLGVVILFRVAVTKGTTAILALQPMILQNWQSDKEIAVADRSVQAAQVKATQDVVSALSGVTDAVRNLSGEVREVRADVGQLKTDRLADNRRISALAAQVQQQAGTPRK